LFTTIFNPTRRANGEGSTLGTVIFDIELVSVRHQWSQQVWSNMAIKYILLSLLAKIKTYL